MEQPSGKGFFTKNLKQHLIHKKNDDESTTKESQSLTYYKGILYVPSKPTQLHIFQACHNLPYVGNIGVNKMIKFISRDLWWPQMWKFVKKFICICDMCAQTKDHVISHMVYYIQYAQFLKVHDCLFLWTLSWFPMFQALQLHSCVFDQLRKMAHFIPTTKMITSEGITKLFFNNIYTYHGLPLDIILNCEF